MKTLDGYPTGLEKGPMKLPTGTNFGMIKIDDVIIYGKTEYFSSPKNEQPIIFVDVEKPNTNHNYGSTQIHLGCVCNFVYKKHYGKSRPRVDIYLPLSELDHLIGVLMKIKEKVTS